MKYSHPLLWPVSDDGGSSSEILRVLGGPAIGDIRSRLIRLITTPDQSSATSSTTQAQTTSSNGISTTQAVHDLFAHRFPKDCSERQAREMWADLVEGKGPLWRDVPADRRECIRCEWSSDQRRVSWCMISYRLLSLLCSLQHPHPATVTQTFLVPELLGRECVLGRCEGHVGRSTGSHLHVPGSIGFSRGGSGVACDFDES